MRDPHRIFDADWKSFGISDRRIERLTPVTYYLLPQQLPSIAIPDKMVFQSSLCSYIRLRFSLFS